MSAEAVATKRIEVNQPLESSIQIGLAALLVIGCLLIMKPFVPLLLWAIIITIASYPTFLKLERVLKGKRGLAATVWTLLLLAVLILPLVLLGQSLAQGIQPIVAGMRDGTLVLPPPPESVASWPLIGAPLFKTWSAASANLSATLMKFAPQIKSAVPGILAASAGFAGTLVQLLISIVLSGVLLANAQAAYEVTRSLANRLFGEQGPEFQSLVGSTIRSVTNGVLGSCPYSNGVRGGGVFRFWTSRRRRLVSRLPCGCDSSGRDAGPDTSGDLRVRHRIGHQGCNFPRLVHHRRTDGQRSEAGAPGTWRCRSHRSGVSGSHRRLHGHGPHRPISWGYRAVRRLQAVSCLGRGRQRRAGRIFSSRQMRKLRQ